MAKFIINGPARISGEFAPVGNKNAALPMLAACLLTDETLRISNVPAIEDVRVMLEILAEMGVAVAREGDVVELNASGLHRTDPPPELSSRIRASIVLAGPLSARHGSARVYTPGGDAIGRRRVDTHFMGLQALGIEVEAGPGHKHFNLRRRQLAAADMILDEASVTATENIVMAATLAPGQTSIYNAACEPHVQDLCRLLNKMGAKISGIGTNRISVEGVAGLHGAEHAIEADYVEVGSLLAAAAATGGALRIPAVGGLPGMEILRRSFRKLGVEWCCEDGNLVLPAEQELLVRSDLGESIPKVEDGIWPAFPSDLMSVTLVLATQASGTVLFFEKLFESRMYFVDRLIEMGARIVQCDPHRVVVSGPARLYGTHQTSPDIRAGMALLIAALCAEGESVIENAQMIDRGYADIDARLRALGADIRRED
jgi:UDP-N-acetylglucosamine 1-carboxyvinyltransferase